MPREYEVRNLIQLIEDCKRINVGKELIEHLLKQKPIASNYKITKTTPFFPFLACVYGLEQRIDACLFTYEKIFEKEKNSPWPAVFVADRNPLTFSATSPFKLTASDDQVAIIDTLKNFQASHVQILIEKAKQTSFEMKLK